MTVSAAEAPSLPARRKQRLARAIIGLALLLFTARSLAIGSAYNHTFDEPTQIVSGLELWQYGTFTLHSDVPPLAKLMMAAPAFLAGVRLDAPPQRGDFDSASQVLYGSGRYWFVLRSARAVNTAIGVLLILALAAYAWRVFGAWAGVAAAGAGACSPGLVSAASIANSDILGVLTVLVTFHAFRRLLVAPNLPAALVFAVALAAAFATKLSAVPFFAFGFPVLAVFTCGRQILEPLRSPLSFARRAAPIALVCIVVSPVLIWSTYRFRLAAPVGTEEATRLSAVLASAHPDVASVVTRLPATPVPLGGFVRGVGVGYNISRLGHPAYLMGEFSLHGWPYYFLVTLLLKVPLGMWAAVVCALVLAASRWRTAEGREVLLIVMLCAAILASVSGAGINAGHRHVVSIEALFALAIAGGVGIALTHVRPGRIRSFAVVALTGAILWGTSSSLRAYEDALGYTNALAGEQPDWWFIDSNLDWGQDLERLHDELTRRHVTEEVNLAYFGTADPNRHGIRFRALEPGARPCGWVAVSVNLQRGLVGAGIGELPSPAERQSYGWLLDEVPEATVGTSIRLYHRPPFGTASGSAGAACRAADRVASGPSSRGTSSEK